MKTFSNGLEDQRWTGPKPIIVMSQSVAVCTLSANAASHN